MVVIRTWHRTARAKDIVHIDHAPFELSGISGIPAPHHVRLAWEVSPFRNVRFQLLVPCSARFNAGSMTWFRQRHFPSWEVHLIDNPAGQSVRAAADN